MSHSPAPWTYSKEPAVTGEDDRFIRDASDEALMCDTPYYPWCSSNEDDWPLIATAPELLALAVQYRDDLRHPPSPDSRERRLAVVEALIAKAENRS